MMADSREIMRPRLSMPPAETDLVAQVFEGAEVILEYGSGGTTILAAEEAGKHVTAVESHRAQVRRMRRWFRENPPAMDTTVDVIWVNIGKTEESGRPVVDSKWPRYANYPLGIWRRDGFRHPDAVLVNGRFRIGCALATAFNITRPVTLLFDDYAAHKGYRQLETFLGAPKLTGRMAEFRVTPAMIPADRLLNIVKFMSRI